MSEIFLTTNRDFAAAEHCLRMIRPTSLLRVKLRLIHVLGCGRKDEEAKVEAGTLVGENFASNFVLGHLALRCGAMKAATRRLEKAARESSPYVRELLAQSLAKTDPEAAKVALLEEAKLSGANQGSALRTLWRMTDPKDPQSKLALQRALHWDPTPAPLWKELVK